MRARYCAWVFGFGLALSALMSMPTGGQVAQAADILWVKPDKPAVTLTPRSGPTRCQEAEHVLCAASGLRLWGKEFWVVMDEPALLATFVPGGLELPVPIVPKPVTLPERPKLKECDLRQLEALTFLDDGSVVVATDYAVVAKINREMKVESCWKAPLDRKPLKPNEGFEALFVLDGTVYAISERTFEGKFALYTNPQTHFEFEWKPERPCAVGSLRITDAVEVPRGALLLSSCEVPPTGWRYYLGLLQRVGTAFSVTYTVRIDGTDGLNLEGLARERDVIHVINDDSRGSKREKDTKLWTLSLTPELKKRVEEAAKEE